MNEEFAGLPYRPCVGLMLVNAHGQVFDDIPADADGVQDGEGPFRTLDVRLTDKELGRFETLGDGATAEPLIRRA